MPKKGSHEEVFKQFQLDNATAPDVLPIVPIAGGATLKEGSFKSPNFVHSRSGWTVNSDGGAEFNNITLREGVTVDIAVTAGEAISGGQAVSFSPHDIPLTNLITTVSDVFLGQTVNNRRAADSFVATTAYSAVKATIRARKDGGGTVTSNLKVAVQADSAGSPSGTDLASATIAETSVTSSYQDLTATITGLSLTASNTYWVVWNRADDGVDGSNYYVVARDGSGSHKYWNGAWSTDSNGDLIYKVEGFGGAGVADTVYLSTALIQDSTDKFIGLAVSTMATAGSGTVRTSGVLSGLSGLTATSTYYLSDTLGSYAVSAGTVSKKIGRAINATEFQVNYTL